MARFTNLIVFLVVLDILAVAGGIIDSQHGTTACWLSVASNGNFSGCSLFTTGTSVITLFGGATIIAGLLFPTKLEQVASVAFIVSLLAIVGADISAFYGELNAGLIGYFGATSVYIAALFIAPLVVMSFFIVYDWWRSSVSP